MSVKTIRNAQADREQIAVKSARFDSSVRPARSQTGRHGRRDSVDRHDVVRGPGDRADHLLGVSEGKRYGSLRIAVPCEEQALVGSYAQRLLYKIGSLVLLTPYSMGLWAWA
jgi:hypothetical protein